MHRSWLDRARLTALTTWNNLCPRRRPCRCDSGGSAATSPPVGRPVLPTLDTLLRLSVLTVVIATQAACVPMVTRQWQVQPVSGRVFDAATGAPVTGARIVSHEEPPISTVTDDAGRFRVEAQSSVGFHMAMPASYIAYRLWRVEHEDYGVAVGATGTLAPPLEEQPTRVDIPLFAGIEPGPADCPYGPYLLRLADWVDSRPPEARDQHNLWVLAHYTRCANPEYQKALSDRLQ